MQAIRVRETGGPEVMHLEELPTPEVTAGHVLVRVEAAGVNYIDTYQRSGQYKVALPYTPGLEGAGTIEWIGAGVEGLSAGMRVAWTSVPGAYATHALVPADKVVEVPTRLSAQEGAAAPTVTSAAPSTCSETRASGTPSAYWVTPSTACATTVPTSRAKRRRSTGGASIARRVKPSATSMPR